MLQLSHALQDSYLDSKSYPVNLIPGCTVTYPTVLKAYLTHLDAEENDLVMSDERFVEISFRDFQDGPGQSNNKAFLQRRWCKALISHRAGQDEHSRFDHAKKPSGSQDGNRPCKCKNDCVYDKTRSQEPLHVIFNRGHPLLPPFC